jgi:hypothetical protein
MGHTFQGDIERECEETHFPREIELKGRREGEIRGGAHISMEREGTHPKEILQQLMIMSIQQ